MKAFAQRAGQADQVTREGVVEGIIGKATAGHSWVQVRLDIF